ncbi:MAG TPA: phytoene/squalene synthase family protein [Pseudolabrys sp.]|nr:phytoene/squalene synthase family protein [Pseudolabrys sp.]
MDNFEHCAALVREADPDRFLASLFAPDVRRGALYALYAFNAEIVRIRDAAREPMAGEIRLQWWRDVLAGERAGEARAHPVAAALCAIIERYAIDRQPLSDLIDAHGFDLYSEPMAELSDLEIYAERTEATVFALAADILADRSVAASAVIRHAGIAYAITALLRDFARDASRRRIYVPLDLLTRRGVVTQTAFVGQTTDGLSAALAELRLNAQHHLDLARENMSALPEAILPALLPVALVRPALARMERNGDNPFTSTAIPRWRRQWRLWRAAHNPNRIFD